MRTTMITLIILLVMALTGCWGHNNNDPKPTPDPKTETPKTPPAAKPAPPKPLTEQIQDRKAPAQCSDKELDARRTENRAIGQIVDGDDEQCDIEQTTRWVHGWETWAKRLGLGGLGLGIVAAFVIAYFLKKVKLGLFLGGGICLLGLIGCLFAQIAAHWQAVMLTALILGVIAVAVWIVLIVEGKLAQFKDGIKVLSSQVDFSKLTDALANSAEHNVVSLQALIDKSK